jgi:cyclohexanone monooxygenase
MGNNIPGKPRRVLVYLAGAPTYRAKCDDVVSGGYHGFRLSASADDRPRARASAGVTPAG